jgi:hypothetical protein
MSRESREGGLTSRDRHGTAQNPSVIDYRLGQLLGTADCEAIELFIKNFAE